MAPMAIRDESTDSLLCAAARLSAERDGNGAPLLVMPFRSTCSAAPASSMAARPAG